MIEGLRVLPGWQDAMTEAGNQYQRDCDTCMKNLSPLHRQTLRCGYLPIVETIGGSRARTFVPGYLRDELATLDVCPGYSTALPEVQEVAALFPQWKAGYAAEFLGGKPSPEILYACSVLDNAVNARDAQRLEDARKERERT